MLGTLRLGGFEIFLVFFGLAFAILSFAFWVWMLIDCIQHESNAGNEKAVWVIVIALLHFLGALIYFFVRKLPRKKSGHL